MYKNKVVIFYLLMLVNHVAHVFEEIWGRFWLIGKVGFGLYLLINWLLLCIPVILFYFVLHHKRLAYKLSIIYTAFMALQGIGHSVASIITGKYFNGFAGGSTGIGLFVIGSALAYYLLKDMKHTELLV